MSLVLLLLLTLVQSPDDVTDWIRQLGGDSIVEREEATRRLISLGEKALDPLEKARKASSQPEAKARIENVIAGIHRAVALAKVFGPARRVTIAARKQPLKEILPKFAISGITLDPGALDEEARVDFQVRDVTWWEALDRFAKATGSRYDLEREEDAGFLATFKKGPAREVPVLYLEQFRISVAETQRIEVRTPGGVTSIGLAIVEVRHQPDLKPSGSYEPGIRITSVKDEAGRDASAKEIPGSCSYEMSLPLADSTIVWVRPEAASLSVEGVASLRFSGGFKDVSLDLEGAGAKTKLGNFEIRVVQFSPSSTSTIVRIRAESREATKPADRLEGGSLHLVDSKGSKHEGEVRWTRTGDESAEWECEFTSGIEGPRRVTFRWVADFHDVEIPFRLEGIRLPEAK